MSGFFLKKCDSTHLIAKNLLKPEGSFIDAGIDVDRVGKVLTLKQDFFITSKKMTAGITTKHGVSWFAPVGNVYLTMVFFKKNLTMAQDDNILTNFQLISTVAIVVFKFIKKFVKNLKIKWPNDIIVEDKDRKIFKRDKKICGIMSENLKEAVIISVAFNIFKFPKKTLNFPATSISHEVDLTKEEIKKLKNTSNICFEIFSKIKINFLKIRNNDKFFDRILSFFIRNTYKIGKKIKIKYHSIEKEKIEVFKLISISKNGEIIVKKDDTLFTFNACEVVF